MLSVKLLCAAVDGSPTSSHAPTSREREGRGERRERREEREGREQLTYPQYPHHLLSGKRSQMGFSFSRRSVFTLQKKEKKENDIHAAVVQTPGASSECALRLL